MSTRASNVSRTLKTYGITTSPADRKYKHEGVFVSQVGDTVSVLVDFLGPRKRQAVVEGVTEVLTGRGYTVEPNPYDPAILHVSRPVDPQKAAVATLDLPGAFDDWLHGSSLLEDEQMADHEDVRTVRAVFERSRFIRRGRWGHTRRLFFTSREEARVVLDELEQQAGHFAVATSDESQPGERRALKVVQQRVRVALDTLEPEPSDVAPLPDVKSR